MSIIELRSLGLPTSDPRWSSELAGGATMDLGRYVLNARPSGRSLAWRRKPSVISAEAILKEPNIDAAMRVELAYPSGIRGQLHWDMNAEAPIDGLDHQRRRAGRRVVPGVAWPTWTTGS